MYRRKEDGEMRACMDSGVSTVEFMGADSIARGNNEDYVICIPSVPFRLNNCLENKLCIK